MARSNVAQGFVIAQDGAQVENCAAVSNSNGFYVNNVPNVRVIGCRAYANASIGFFGTGSSSTGLVFSGCQAATNTGHGFLLNGQRNLVTGCNAISNLGSGIAMVAAYSLVSGCEATHNGQSGILLQTANWSNADGNLCVENGQYGISVQSSPSSLVVGNLCAANGTVGPSGSYDNIVIQSSDDCFVEGNTVRQGGNANKPRYGILVFSSTNVFVGLNDTFVGGVAGGFGDSGTNTRRVVKSQGIFTYGSTWNPQAISAGTAVNVGAAQPFRVDHAGSVIRVTAQASIQLGAFTVGGTVIGSIAVDGGTYAVSNQYANTSGDYIYITGGSVSIYGLPVGNHTVGFQVFSGPAVNGYMRANGAEYLTLRVEEFAT